MSLIEWASGYRNANDEVDANPHTPYIHDAEAIPAHLLKGGGGGTKEFSRTSIALLFDEDDANRSSTGSEKIDKALFKVFPAMHHMAADYAAFCQGLHDGNGIENEVDDQGGEEEAFIDQLQLRARVVFVYANTATPMTLLHEVEDSKSKAIPIMIELSPGKNYVGYKTKRSQKKFPWLEKFITVETMPNRVKRKPLSQTYILIRKCLEEICRP